MYKCFKGRCVKCRSFFQLINPNFGYYQTGYCSDCQQRYCCRNCFLETNLTWIFNTIYSSDLMRFIPNSNGYCEKCYNLMKCPKCHEFNYGFQCNKNSCPKCLMKNDCSLCEKVNKLLPISNKIILACVRCGQKYCSTNCMLKDWQKHKLTCQKNKREFLTRSFEIG